MVPTTRFSKPATNRRRAWLALAAWPLWFAATAANAQSTALPAPTRTANVTVTPAVADVGLTRSITVSGNWNNGCVPVGARVDSASDSRQTVHTITLEIPLTLIACLQSFQPYAQTVTLTPTARGLQRILVMTSLGEYAGEAVLDVRAPGDNAPRTDITGVWYDPATNGSGLTFKQSATRPDLVFGTWYVYSADGGSRWFTIQNTAWKAQGSVLEGDLIETRGNPVTCVQPLDACPVTFATYNIIGKARMTLTTDHAAEIEAFSPLGTKLFGSFIQRIRF